MKWSLLLKLIFVFCFANSMVSSVYANSAIGGEIQYQYLSPNKYKVVFIIYRNCMRPALKTPKFKIRADSTGLTYLIHPLRTSIKDISNVCSKDSLPCMPQNAQSNSGIEQHVYETIINFDTLYFKTIKEFSCKVVFSMFIENRDSMVTTLDSSGFYLDAMLNLCGAGVKGNSSPIFKTLPIKDLCCETDFYYNNGGMELSEGDSISFELIDPLNGVNDVVAHKGGLSASIPMSPYCSNIPIVNCRALPNAKPPRGFYFDKETGDIIFTPMVCNELGVIVLKINEWRKDSKGKWFLIGYVKRETTWSVKTCNKNNSPYVAGNNKYNVCEGDKICFTFFARDPQFLPYQTNLDTVQLYWDSSIPGASFKIVDPLAREKEAEFCWQTSIGDARSDFYRFTALCSENNCNDKLKVSRGFLIKVKPKAKDKLVYKKLFKGGLEILSVNLDSNNWSKNIIKNTIRDSSANGPIIYSSANKSKDTVVFNKAGKYILLHEIYNKPYNCPTFYYDTITVTADDLTGIVNYRKIDLNVYPNPSNGQISFNSSSIDLSKALIKVYAVDGKLVAEKQLQAGSTDLSSLAKGIYTIAIKVEEFSVFRQLIIE
jgi:hypothetical protein